MSEYFRKPIVKILMLKGQDAVSISDIEKKSSSGLTDTYEITLTDGTKRTFNVSNGKGIKSIAKTSTSGLIDTYTTTYNDNTTSTFTIKNGEKGDTGSIENLEIGGTNLIVNSNFDGTTNPREHWENWGSPKTREIVNNNGINYLHIISENDKYNGYSQRIDSSLDKEYKKFTYSFIGYSHNEHDKCNFGIHFLKKDETILGQLWGDFTLSTTPKKYSFLANIPSYDFYYVRIMLGIGDGISSSDIYIGKPKLELGEIATDWTPSLEDIENTYSTKSDVENTYATKSDVEQKNSAINDRVEILERDTGWGDLYRNSDESSYVKARQKNGVVYIEGSSGSTGIEITANTFTTVAELPHGYEPNEEFVFAVSLKGDTAYASGTITTDGKINLYCKSKTKYWGFCISYPI